MVDLPLVPVITTFVENGEYLSIVLERATAFASSILSVIIKGKPNFSAISTAQSFGVWVIRQAIFLSNAMRIPVPLIQCLITISPVCASFKKVNLPIKPALLEQSIIAGIGNIYADEICFACKISPFKKASELTLSECENIVKEASRILTEAIKLGGSTIKSFQSTHGVDGLFQQKLLVYGKQSVPCINCNTPIEKTFVKQRGTHYCPNCQKG